jgi:hypothetical protein
MANKKTKREYFEGLKANYNLTDDEITFINHELELLVKKNSAERKPTANQLENEKIKDYLLKNMATGTEYTATEIIKTVLANTEWKELSVSRITAILSQLVEDNSLVRDYKKRKALFSIIS